MQEKYHEEYLNILTSKNVVLLTVAGSELLGLRSHEESDRDELGIYVENMREIAGFGTEQHVVWRSAEARTGNANEPSGPGDVDLTLYGLRKFLQLALGGNPTIITALYAPAAFCREARETGLQLQGLTQSIVSRRAGKAFLGYLNQQRLRLVGQRGQMGVNRHRLVEEFGYDTKYATHMLRLGLQGKELLRNGALELPLSSSTREYLLDVRGGKSSLNSVLNHASELEQEIKELMNSSPLPENPDFDGVEQWMLATYRAFWR